MQAAAAARPFVPPVPSAAPPAPDAELVALTKGVGALSLRGGSSGAVLPVAPLARATSSDLQSRDEKVVAISHAVIAAVPIMLLELANVIGQYAKPHMTPSQCRREIGKMDFKAADAVKKLQGYIDAADGLLTIPAKLLTPARGNTWGDIVTHRSLLATVISQTTCTKLEVVPSRWVDGKDVVQNGRRREEFTEHQLIVGLLQAIYDVRPEFFNSIQQFRLHSDTVANIRHSDLTDILKGKRIEVTNAVYIEFDEGIGPLQFTLQTAASARWDGEFPRLPENVTHISVKRWPLHRGEARFISNDDSRLSAWLGVDRAARCVLEETVHTRGVRQDFFIVIQQRRADSPNRAETKG